MSTYRDLTLGLRVDAKIDSNCRVKVEVGSGDLRP